MCKKRPRRSGHQIASQQWAVIECSDTAQYFECSTFSASITRGCSNDNNAKTHWQGTEILDADVQCWNRWNCWRRCCIICFWSTGCRNLNVPEIGVPDERGLSFSVPEQWWPLGCCYLEGPECKGKDLGNVICNVNDGAKEVKKKGFYHAGRSGWKAADSTEFSFGRRFKKTE